MDSIWRYATALGVLGIVSPVFGLSHGAKTNFVLVHGNGALGLVLVGLVALTGAFAKRIVPVYAAGILALVASVLQLVQLGHSSNWLGGNGSTMALFLALAVGLIVTARARRYQAVLAEDAVGVHAGQR